MDFLQQHGLVLDFASTPIAIYQCHIPPRPTYQPLSATRQPVHGRRSSKSQGQDLCSLWRAYQWAGWRSGWRLCYTSLSAKPQHLTMMPQCSADSLSLFLNEYKEGPVTLQLSLLSLTTSTIDLYCNLCLISSFLMWSILVTPATFLRTLIFVVCSLDFSVSLNTHMSSLAPSLHCIFAS